MKSKIRLILDPPRSGTLNMAIDEMLMDRQKDAVLPALRFYTWEVPEVTIGYFQTVASASKLFSKHKKPMSVVRRITGGGLVQHGKDLTFSFITKSPTALLPNDTKSGYLKINEAVRVGLSALYPKIDYADCRTVPSGRAKGERICFEQPACYDLLIEGKKVLGASQRKRNGALLHQSSMQLDKSTGALAMAIIKGFEKNWNVEFVQSALTESEMLEAEALELSRYSDAEWASPSLSGQTI